MSGKLADFWNWARRRGLVGMALVLVAVLSVRSAVADWNDVPTGSMKPTILIGDRIFVNKLAYDLKFPFTGWRLASWDDPDRGDIVTCWSPENGSRLVKRIVGIPGDTIAMRGGRLLLNGQPLAYLPVDRTDILPLMGEDARGKLFYTEDLDGIKHIVTYEPDRRSVRDFAPVTIPSGKYFMMGDNRDNSADSRYFGFVDRGDIIGQATAVALSLDYENWFQPRWSRFFSRLM
jgi:signal peptidase I